MTTKPQSPSEQEIRALVRKDVEQMIHSQYKRDPKDTIESKIDRLGRRISALITQAADKREQEVLERVERLLVHGLQIGDIESKAMSIDEVMSSLRKPAEGEDTK